MEQVERQDKHTQDLRNRRKEREQAQRRSETAGLFSPAMAPKSSKIARSHQPDAAAADEKSSRAAQPSFGERLCKPKMRQFVKGSAPIYRGLSKIPIQRDFDLNVSEGAAMMMRAPPIQYWGGAASCNLAFRFLLTETDSVSLGRRHSSSRLETHAEERRRRALAPPHRL